MVRLCNYFSNIAFFLAAASSSLLLPQRFSRGAPMFSDGEFIHSISSASLSVPSSRQASPSGLVTSFGMSIASPNSYVSLSWYWDDRIFTYLCSFAVFGPAHRHCLIVPSQVSRFQLFCSLTWVTFILLVANRSNALYIDLACFRLLSDCGYLYF